MKASLRARRMARNHKRLGQQAKLNLVSLMDIFTILVFFLMVNNGDVEVLQPDKAISLPESSSSEKPGVHLILKVNDADILLQGRKIDSIAAVLKREEADIPTLGRELLEQAALAPEMTPREQKIGRGIVIMGDRNIPYRVLKRIMASCAASDYRNITLAVNRAPGQAREEVLLAGGRS